MITNLNSQIPPAPIGNWYSNCCFCMLKHGPKHAVVRQSEREDHFALVLLGEVSRKIRRKFEEQLSSENILQEQLGGAFLRTASLDNVPGTDCS